MSLYEFEQCLRIIRDNQKVLMSLYLSLLSTRDEKLALVGNGVVDYSKDRVQTSSDPDAAINNAIYEADEKIKSIMEKIKSLEGEDPELKALLWSGEGLPSEIVRLYFIEGLTMREIAKRFNYDKSYCYKMWRRRINEMYEEYERKHDE